MTTTAQRSAVPLPLLGDATRWEPAYRSAAAGAGLMDAERAGDDSGGAYRVTADDVLRVLTALLLAAAAGAALLTILRVLRDLDMTAADLTAVPL